jgi:hypothetical protein
MYTPKPKKKSRPGLIDGGFDANARSDYAHRVRTARKVLVIGKFASKGWVWAVLGAPMLTSVQRVAPP